MTTEQMYLKSKKLLRATANVNIPYFEVDMELRNVKSKVKIKPVSWNWLTSLELKHVNFEEEWTFFHHNQDEKYS